MPEDEIVTVRLPPKDSEAIERLVKRGEFRNRSDLIRYAIKAVLAEYRGAPTLSDEVDVPGLGLPKPGEGALTSAMRRSRGSASRHGR